MSEKSFNTEADAQTQASQPPAQKSAYQKCATRFYTLIALASGISFSFHNIFFFSQTGTEAGKDLGWLLLLPYWIGELPFVLVFLIIGMCRNKEASGSYWSRATSNYYEPIGEHDSDEYKSADRQYQIKWFNVIGVIWRTVLIFFNLGLFWAVLVSVGRAGVNLAVIVSLFVMAAFFSALVFWLMFGEQLQTKHYVGMVLLGIAVLIISLSSDSGHSLEEDGVSENISIFWPILFAVLTCVNHTAITVTGRYWQLKGGIPSFALTSDAFLLHCIICFVLQLWYSLAYEPMPASVVTFMALGAFFCMLGFYLIAEACVYGKAGPAQALMELQCIWQLFMEIAIWGNQPSVLQGVGMCFALVGAIVTSIEFGGSSQVEKGENEKQLLDTDEAETKETVN